MTTIIMLQYSFWNKVYYLYEVEKSDSTGPRILCKHVLSLIL